MKQSIRICKLVSILFLAFILLAIPCMGQKTDLQKENIKGYVTSVTETEYNFAFRFGEYERGNAKVTSHKFFDENGMIYKKSGYQIYDIVYYTYVEGNKPLSIITYSPQSVKYKRFESSVLGKDKIKEFEYNNGVLQEYNEYAVSYTNDGDYSRRLWRKYKYSYDSGKTIVNMYKSDGSQFCRKIITTSGNSKMVLNLWGATADKEEYLYDSSGLLIQSEQSDSVIGGIISRGKIKYEYDANDDLVREIHGDVVYVFKYEYDSHHNWVVKKKFLCPPNKDAKMVLWVERNIQYADFQGEVFDLRKSVLAKDSLSRYSQRERWKQAVDSIQRLDSIAKIPKPRKKIRSSVPTIFGGFFGD